MQPDPPGGQDALEREHRRARRAMREQAGHDGDADAARDELVDGRPVVGAHDDAGADAEARERGVEVALARRAAVLGDEIAVVQVVRDDRAIELEERIAGRDEQHVRVVEQHRYLVTPVVVDGRENEIERARRKALQQLAGQVGFLDLEHDLGRLLTQRRDDRRHENAGRARDRAEPHGPRRRGGELVQVAACVPDPHADALRVAQQPAAGVRQLHIARSRGASQHVDADDPLEGPDLLAHCRLGVAESRSRTADGAFLGDRRERVEMPHLERRPSDPVRSPADGRR